MEKLDYNYDQTTQEYFIKHDLPYDKIYFGNISKGSAAYKEKLKYFIDDRVYNLDDVAKHDVKCLQFVNEIKNEIIESPYKKFYHWDDIISYIKKRG